jgi:hypothetical protein
MTYKHTPLAARRAALVARIETQRNELNRTFGPVRVPLAALDRSMRGMRFLRDHPILVGVLSAGLMVIRPRGTGKWLRRGWMVWQLMQGFRSRLAFTKRAE